MAAPLKYRIASPAFVTTGTVGVGTASPGQKLSIYTGSTSTSALSFDRYSTGNYRTDIYQNSYGPDFRVGYNTYTPESILYLKRLSDGTKEVEINGNVGMTSSPSHKLNIVNGVLTRKNIYRHRVSGGCYSYFNGAATNDEM